MTFHNQIQLVGTVTVGPKGQVVIPVEVRNDMQIKPGDRLLALYAEDKKSIGFITESQAQQFINTMGDNHTYFRDMVRKVSTEKDND